MTIFFEENKRENLLLALSCFEDFSPQERCQYLMDLDLLLETELEWSGRTRITHLKRREFEQFLADFSVEKAEKGFSEKSIRYVTILDKNYPKLLKHIYAPPLVLFYQGEIELLNSLTLGIVGSRNATNYGLKACEAVIPKLVRNKITIVSGLARGIDTKAHKEALLNGGKTIAVIGTGIDRIYPAENKKLQVYIGRNHLLLSEYPPGTGPAKHHFPYRNRIISGLSLGVLVVEGQRRSGSLITARQALEEGRDVFSVPGSIFNSYSAGCNELIKLGAIPVLKPEDILGEWENLL